MENNNETKKVKKTFWQKVKNAGPAAVITSAFIGPGTVITTTRAGVEFGYALLWAVLFSGIASIIIMRMSSRIAIMGRKNIIDSSIDLVPDSKVWRYFILILIGIVVGLTALGFEAGNLIGATTGLKDIFGTSADWWPGLIVGLISLAAVVYSTPKIVEVVMQVFVALMGIIFVVLSIALGPDFLAILKGLFVPVPPSGSIIIVVGLIGTTIIGINLLFHSIASADKWATLEDLEDSYFDTSMNVGLGVLMTLALVITAATAAAIHNVGMDGVNTFLNSLELILGKPGRVFGAFGLLLAGLSSAIGTPYMTGVIFSRIFKWEEEKLYLVKVVAGIAVVIGTAFAMFGSRPDIIVTAAQAMSGILLPIITLLFLLSANKKELGEHKNNLVQNILGGFAVLVTAVLGFMALYNVFFG